MSEFNLDHLPLRDPLIFQVIQALSGLTVKIDVSYVSEHRPDVMKDTGFFYPYFTHKGNNTLRRTGSGRVFHVAMKFNNCPCSSCKTSSIPNRKYWLISVATATHVVFDSSEAKFSKCHFSFDSDSSKSIVLECLKLEPVPDIEKDTCSLLCVTHDSEFAENLHKRIFDYYNLDRQVSVKYKDSRNDHRLAVIVSHPHGCSKRVSIGTWHERLETTSFGPDMADTKYIYNTCTCPGSSGAPVYILGKELWYNHSHSGAGALGNYSGIKWE